MGGSSVSGGRKFRNEGLKATVKHWCEDSGKAEAKYGHIKDWDMSEVTSMNSLFSADGDHVGEEARQFDDDISSWNVDEVEKMSGMFYEAKSFNQDLSGWNVEKCTDMSVMFIGADKFNKYSVMKLDLSGKTTDIIFEFGVNEGERREDEKKRLAVAASGRKFGNDDLRIAVKEWCEDRGKAEVKYRHISGWDTSEVTDTMLLFSGYWEGGNLTEEVAKRFNDGISGWNVDRVENMGGMFLGAESFNQDLSGWNVEKCEDMAEMFLGAGNFNEDPVKNWDLSGKNTEDMFEDEESGEETIKTYKK
ncbi:hypothetical protein TrLO_g14919 [Triparma laevis f. longispina]|uniref:BspA family leucine-rich repeat surface protein n=1 Tax=Triparma laevis f. longispina TaxID=1714387 RepID=A0A9W7AXW3_9STRA|nr:hypothetical protein TrLO_g14919 [Triparma laevis f. longispina]